MSKTKALLKLWPPGLELTQAMRDYAVERGIDADAEWEAFHDWCDANAARYADFPAAWRTRIRNCVRWSGERRPIGFRVSPPPVSRPVLEAVARENAEIADEVRNMTPDQRREASRRLRAIVAGIGRKL